MKNMYCISTLKLQGYPEAYKLNIYFEIIIIFISIWVLLMLFEQVYSCPGQALWGVNENINKQSCIVWNHIYRRHNLEYHTIFLLDRKKSWWWWLWHFRKLGAVVFLIQNKRWTTNEALTTDWLRYTHPNRRR